MSTTESPQTPVSPSEPVKPATVQHPVDKLAYNVTELCAAIGVCRCTLYNLEKRGKLRSVPGLRHKLYPKSEVERFLSGAAA